MKWQDVQAFVLCGTGSDALVVRGGLAEATVVMVDPTPLLRETDFALLPLTGLPPVAEWYGYPRLRELRRQLDHHVSRILIGRSGARRVVELLWSPLGPVDLGDGDEPLARHSAAAMHRRLGGGLKKAALFAAKATTLMTHEYDPDGRAALATGLESLAATLRYMHGTEMMNRLRLSALTGRRVVFDQGQADVIEAVAALQREAQERLDLYAPYLGLVGGHCGYVRSADDREELRLQIADIAAGWARDVIQSRGLFETGRLFRLVIYNGEQLDADEARRFDQERALHRRLIASVRTSR